MCQEGQGGIAEGSEEIAVMRSRVNICQNLSRCTLSICAASCVSGIPQNNTRQTNRQTMLPVGCTSEIGRKSRARSLFPYKPLDFFP